MKWLANMDLYKGMILASCVLLPAAGWWIKTSSDGIAAANRAITEATKPGGHIEEIGKLLKQLEVVEANKSTLGKGTDTETYFSGQIFRSVSQQGSLDTNSFKFAPVRDEVVQTSSKQSARDFIVKIDWPPRGGKDFVFSRDFLFAVLFNCESGARGGNAPQVPSIWRLYSLKLTNATVQKESVQQMVPPPETEDRWIVGKMEFARREPNKGAK